MASTATERLSNDLATAFGAALRLTFAALSRVRPSAKPLHPRGTVMAGGISRDGLDVPVGVPWIDHPGSEEVLVRISRSLGLPAPLPDVYGMAIRVPCGSQQHGDLLLSTTGASVLTRFLLAPTRSSGRRTYSSLLPYRTPSGPLLLAAAPRAAHGRDFDLLCARPTGPFRRFGRLHLQDSVDPEADAPVSFDPVINTLPGLLPYGWAARLREGAYAAARRSRGVGDP
jgi:hypothetical protein